MLQGTLSCGLGYLSPSVADLHSRVRLASSSRFTAGKGSSTSRRLALHSRSTMMTPNLLTMVSINKNPTSLSGIDLPQTYHDQLDIWRQCMKHLRPETRETRKYPDFGYAVLRHRHIGEVYVGTLQHCLR